MNIDEKVLLEDKILSIMSWNIHGELSVLLRGPDAWTLEGYNVMFFCETWMDDDEHLALPIPPGFSFLSFPRPVSLAMRRHMGGLAVLYRADLQLTIPDIYVTSEYLVIVLLDMCIVGAYLPPRGSPWLDALDEDPCDGL